MRVEVLYFGVLKDKMGVSGEALEAADRSDVREVLRLARRGDVGGSWGTLAVAVNREYASLETVLHEGDEVALLPPVSGGSR